MKQLVTSSAAPGKRCRRSQSRRLYKSHHIGVAPADRFNRKSATALRFKFLKIGEEFLATALGERVQITSGALRDNRKLNAARPVRPGDWRLRAASWPRVRLAASYQEPPRQHVSSTPQYTKWRTLPSWSFPNVGAYVSRRRHREILQKGNASQQILSHLFYLPLLRIGPVAVGEKQCLGLS